MVVMKNKKSCPNCDKELDNDWMYCPYCGTKVT
jgi:RNA polymerase subunit RPABC4/transcription elongation factor Spt4